MPSQAGSPARRVLPRHAPTCALASVRWPAAHPGCSSTARAAHCSARQSSPTSSSTCRWVGRRQNGAAMSKHFSTMAGAWPSCGPIIGFKHCPRQHCTPAWTLKLSACLRFCLMQQVGVSSARSEGCIPVPQCAAPLPRSSRTIACLLQNQRCGEKDKEAHMRHFAWSAVVVCGPA